jgi:FdhD protein
MLFNCIFGQQIKKVKATILFPGKKYADDQVLDVSDALTVEEILNISINGEPYTMTMRSPGDEEDLVRGILLSEDVYDDLSTNPRMLITERNEKGFVTKMNVLLPEDKIKSGIDSKRNLISVSSCGMCGKSEMELSLYGDVIVPRQKLKIENVAGMFELMSEQQSTFKDSGGSHASAAFTVDVQMLAVKEDIGRHNAVDKVIGSLLQQQKLHLADCLLVSGRLSYEIVSKCFRARIPFLAAVSAPSSMAIEYCEKTGITLLAFCRQNKCTVYTHTENIA